jgi:hypothetical protein
MRYCSPIIFRVSCIPAASRDELLDQVVPLRKRYIKYHQYASVEIKDLVDEARLKAARRWDITELNHCVYLSDGKGSYRKKTLPLITQSSRIFSMGKTDSTGTEKSFLLAGNFFPWRTQWGRNDSGLGSLLRISKDSIDVVENSEIGLFIDGDVRDMAIINNAENLPLVIVAKNNGQVQLIKLSAR